VPLQLGERTAVLTGVVTVDEAEPLAGWLRTRGSTRTPARIDLGECSHLHTAVFQALLAARAQISVLPVDPFLQTWAASVFERAPDVGSDTRSLGDEVSSHNVQKGVI
jgi:hypothetical protein